MRMGSVVAALAILLAACGASPSPEASGAEIYAQLCARCHGVDLEGRIGPALGAGSAAAAAPDEFLKETIVRGRGRMPSFRLTLSDEQVDRVIAYLRERQR